MEEGLSIELWMSDFQIDLLIVGLGEHFELLIRKQLTVFIVFPVLMDRKGKSGRMSNG